MAIIKQGILGGIQNKIGNVVGSSWKGISVLKSLPVSVANPRTAGQVAQRNRFSFTVAFATAILAEVIKPLWDRFAQRQSGYNAFVSRNIQCFSDTGLTSPENLVISSGKMSATTIASVSNNIARTVVMIAWTDDSGQGFKQATDTLFVVLRNRTTEEIKAYGVATARTAEVQSLPIAMSAGDVIDVWMAFRRVDGTIVSDSSYSSFTVS